MIFASLSSIIFLNPSKGFFLDLFLRCFTVREKVALVCTECGARNYNASKKKGDATRLGTNKYCPKCGKYTLHKEGK